MKIKLGISACLLGQNVRYDGGHTLDHYLNDTLGKHVEWAPVCPEVECGLGVPREAMRLVGAPQNNRLVTINNGIDHTRTMKQWADKKIAKLAREELCGFVFKTRSPSSGLHDVKIYGARGVVSIRGSGMFAREFVKAFPLVPVEDEERLRDERIRENFVDRVFAFARWKEFLRQGPTVAGLIGFHTDHKLQIMAHSPQLVRDLGKIVAAAAHTSLVHACSDYANKLFGGLTTPSTAKKNVNVLQHAMGYFKKQLSAQEKRELLEIISDYHKGFMPLIAPVLVLRHYIRKYDNPFLQRQHYFFKHPSELKLRNHA
jgi:uncharacterized protein YbgA (DUF1722 family)/uncharacterized protein YbbK (DUF523 family)